MIHPAKQGCYLGCLVNMLQNVFEFLFSLNRVSITPGTRFHFAVDWRGWILPAVITLFAIGWWSYRRQSVATGRRVWLWIVRGTLLAALFMLFCRPELVLDREERIRSVVAVWVDSSASMTLEDSYKDAPMAEFVRQLAQQNNGVPPDQTRLNRYQVSVATLNNAQWLKTLAETQDISFYSGSSHARLLGTAYSPQQVQTWVDQLKAEKPTGESTDVPTVIREILQSVQGTHVSALVLLTDGQTNESGSRMDQSIALARSSNAKVFALPLGQKEEPFNLKLSNMQVPPQAFVHDPVAVKVRISGTGIDRPTQIKASLYRKQDETLTLLHDRQGAPVEKVFTLEPGHAQIDTELIFNPDKKGGDAEDFDLIAKIEPVDMTAGEELTVADNQQNGRTRVIDAQINVLYVDGYPRWEFRYLKNELIRERTVNVSALLLSADMDFAQEGDPRIVDSSGHEKFPGPITRFPETAEELRPYDVILIGDVEASYFSPSQQKLILDFVKNSGGGVGWIAGPNFNPETYKGTPLESLLPILPDEVDLRMRVMPLVDNKGFNLELTAAGKESNLFRFFDDPEANVKQIADMPPMYWYKPIVGLRPAAEVLAVHPTDKQGGLPVPLIVTGRNGKGRTMFSAVCDTWRWRRYTGEPLFQSYWLQMCRLLYEGKATGDAGRLQLIAESSRVEVGKPIKLKLAIHDPTLLGQIPTKVPVTVTDNAGHAIATIVLQRSTTGSEERLEGMTTATQIGEMTLRIEPGVLPTTVENLQILIERPGREMQTTTADLDSLETLATRTTGEVLPPYRADQLSKLIPDRGLPTIHSLSEELWDKPIALVLVVGLATIEWLLRKRAGLI